jgi:hypothetical protein
VLLFDYLKTIQRILSCVERFRRLSRVRYQGSDQSLPWVGNNLFDPFGGSGCENLSSSNVTSSWDPIRSDRVFVDWAAAGCEGLRAAASSERPISNANPGDLSGSELIHDNSHAELGPEDGLRVDHRPALWLVELINRVLDHGKPSILRSACLVPQRQVNSNRFAVDARWMASR